jgi:hypothetical protein
MADHFTETEFTGEAGGSIPHIPFVGTATIHAGAAVATPVTLLADTAVPAGKKVYLTGWRAYLSGATDWTAGTSGTVFAKLSIQDSNGTPVVFADILLAALAGGPIVITPSTANVTSYTPYSANTGGTTAKGLVVVGNHSATTPGVGSDVIVTVHGVIK